jgi:tight adherence protein C
MLMWYLGVALIGGSVGILVTAKRSEPGAGRSASEADLHQQRLAQSLLTRLGAPLAERFVGIARRLTPKARGNSLRLRLDNAGQTVSVEAFLSLKAVAAAGGLLLATLWALLVDPAPLRLLVAAAFGGALGYFAPDLTVRSRGANRQSEISRALPEALDLLALTVQAGLGLEQGIAEVSGEVSGPLGDELDRMLKEQQLGRSRREALEALHARNRSTDLRLFIEALLHADRLGAPVGETLRVQARELRRRRRAHAREQAGKAPVKLLFPLIFGIFPAMFVVILGPAAIRIAQSLFAD